jgi:transcriptional repressor NrdR
VKVIKRDGKLQNFDLNKIKNSISRASDDAEQSFNESDIDNLSKSIEAAIEKLKKDNVDVDVVQNLVLMELENSGFNVVSKYYNLGNLD